MYLNRFQPTAKRLLFRRLLLSQVPSGLPYSFPWRLTKAKLMKQLADDDVFLAETNRPHDDAALFAEIKRRAVELHEVEVIVTIAGQKVTLDEASKHKT